MILPIVKIGHPTLRAKAKLITEINDEIKEVIDNMIETMDSFKGIGLAAPQIGISLSLIIADLTILEGEGQIIIINPKIIEYEGKEVGEEGCLSIPEINENVKRHKHILIEGLDEEGNPIRIEREDLMARVLQHEIDHLEGILFVDRISMVKKHLIKKKLKQIAQKHNPDEQSIRIYI